MVEVGNLAARGAGLSRLLIVALTRLLAAEGVRWAGFTGTPALISSFRRLGIVLHGLVRPIRAGWAYREQWRAEWGQLLRQPPAGDGGRGAGRRSRARHDRHVSPVRRAGGDAAPVPEALWAAIAAYGEWTALRDAAGEWSGQRVLAEVEARRAVLDVLGAQRVALALEQRRRLDGLGSGLARQRTGVRAGAGLLLAAAAGPCASTAPASTR